VGKTNFTSFGPPRKILEKALVAPLEKILPTPMVRPTSCGQIIDASWRWLAWPTRVVMKLLRSDLFTLCLWIWERWERRKAIMGKSI